MRVTALAENTACSGEFGAEHGLSLYIETQKKKILFDMGQSDLFEQNALRCGIDLSKVDFAVLSHGHYDHSGGMERFLALNHTAPVYLSRFAFEPHYNAEGKYIGADQSLKNCGRLVYTDEICRIGEGITLYSCNERERPHGFDSAGLTVMRDGEMMPDDFRHEQYLMIEEGGKRILFSGCSHKGILNIVGWFQPDVLVGGFHFFKMPADDGLIPFARQLDRCETRFYTCHCTGTEQYQVLKRHMRRLDYLSAGESITL